MQLEKRLHDIQHRVFGKVVIRDGQLKPVITIDSQLRQSSYKRYQNVDGGVVFKTVRPSARSKRDDKYTRGRNNPKPPN